jgi:hypothetical protein
MKIGFTGTRKGMTKEQKWKLLELVAQFAPAEFHHGDCVGSDDEAATTVDAFSPASSIVLHPPARKEFRAFNCATRYCLPKQYLARNRDIVDETDMLIATPAEAEHQDRGGTWYTIDYAAKVGKRVIIICPDGTTANRR